MLDDGRFIRNSDIPQHTTDAALADLQHTFTAAVDHFQRFRIKGMEKTCKVRIRFGDFCNQGTVKQAVFQRKNGGASIFTGIGCKAAVSIQNALYITGGDTAQEGRRAALDAAGKTADRGITRFVPEKGDIHIGQAVDHRNAAAGKLSEHAADIIVIGGRAFIGIQIKTAADSTVLHSHIAGAVDGTYKAAQIAETEFAVGRENMDIIQDAVFQHKMIGDRSGKGTCIHRAAGIVITCNINGNIRQNQIARGQAIYGIDQTLPSGIAIHRQTGNGVPLSVQRDAHIAICLDGGPVAARKINIRSQNKTAAGRKLLKIVRTCDLGRIFCWSRYFCQKTACFGKGFQRCTGLFQKTVTSDVGKFAAYLADKIIGIRLRQ